MARKEMTLDVRSWVGRLLARAASRTTVTFLVVTNQEEERRSFCAVSVGRQRACSSSVSCVSATLLTMRRFSPSLSRTVARSVSSCGRMIGQERCNVMQCNAIQGIVM